MVLKFPRCLVWRSIILFCAYSVALSVPMLWAMDRNESPRILKAFASGELAPALDIIQVRLSEEGGLLRGRLTLRGLPNKEQNAAYLLEVVQQGSSRLWLYVEQKGESSLFTAQRLADGQLCATAPVDDVDAKAGRVDGIHIDYSLPLTGIDYAVPLTYSAQSLSPQHLAAASALAGSDGVACEGVFVSVDIAPHPRAPQKTIHPIALTNRLCDGRY